MNGYAKADAHKGIDHAGNRRVRGIAAQTLLLAFQLAHANERKTTPGSPHSPAPRGAPTAEPAIRHPSRSTPGHPPGTSPRPRPESPALTTPAHHHKPDPRAEATFLRACPSGPSSHRRLASVTTRTPKLASSGAVSSLWG